MNGRADRAAAWIYTGIWAVLVKWFRVPQDPPTLPTAPGEKVESFQPAPAFLSYLKFWFWLAVIAKYSAFFAVGFVTVATALVAVGLWTVPLLLLPLAFLLIVGPDLPVYVGLHLRYDTTWYVLSERSMRIRGGLWVIEETTITFENVQNVKLTQNPLQRYFGIANVLVDTAGGSSDAKHKSGGSSHQGIVEGVTQETAARVREMILAKLRRSASAGLGDDARHQMAAATGAPKWSPQHVALLREIQGDLAALNAIAQGGLHSS